MPSKIILCFIFALCTTAAASENCSKCHAIPQDSSHKVHASANILTPVYGDTRFTFQYLQNAKEYAFNCGNCHPQDISFHDNGSIDIELFTDSSSGLKRLNSKDASFDRQEKTCSGVYCHSTGEKSTFREYRKTPSWGTSLDTFRCQQCHGTPPAYDNKEGRENSHFNTVRGSGHLLGIHWDSTKGHSQKAFSLNHSSDMGCSTCHFSTVTKDTDTTFEDPVTDLFTCSRCHDDKTVMGKNRPGTIANKALHVNGVIEVSFKPEKFRTTAQLTLVPAGWRRFGDKPKPLSYDETEQPLSSSKYIPERKTCLTIACHLLGTEVRWGESVNCDSCHRDFTL